MTAAVPSSAPSSPLQTKSSELKDSAHALQSELQESLEQHATRSTTALEARLRGARSSLEDVEKMIEQEIRHVENVAQLAERELRDTLTELLKRVQGCSVETIEGKVREHAGGLPRGNGKGAE